TLVEKGADVQAMLTPILNALQDSDPDDFLGTVRSAALEALRPLMEKGADVHVLVTPILEGLKDGNADAWSAASDILPTLVEKGADIDAIITVIEDAIKDSYSDYGYFQQDIIDVLTELVGKDIKVAKILSLISQVLACRHSEHWQEYYFGHAIDRLKKALGTLLEKGTDVDEIWKFIRDGMSVDYYEDEFILAADFLPELVHKGIEIAGSLPLILKALLKTSIYIDIEGKTGYGSSHVYDPGRVIDRLTEALVALLELAKDVDLDDSLKTIQDDDNHWNWSRLFEALSKLIDKRTEVTHITSLISKLLTSKWLNNVDSWDEGDGESLYEVLTEVLSKLISKSTDISEISVAIQSTIRGDGAFATASLQSLPPLLEKGADVQELLPLILNALQHSDSYVRRAALQALRTLVEKGADVQVLLPHILNALQDRNSDVRRATLEALEKISTELLIDHYWGTKDKNVVPVIIPRLYEVALTVEYTRNSGQQKLVLRSTKGDVVEVWERPKEELEEFKQFIRGARPYRMYTPLSP
ncbi:MAG: HEAT repeat domain-containing protein, partial [Bacteroidota bacterium]